MRNEMLRDFVDAACVPLDSAHASGTLDRAQAILAAYPEIADESIHAAAILGRDAVVRRWLDLDRANATIKGGPRNWDALTHLCFSKYLRLDRARAQGFVNAARALLDAGASARTGFYSNHHHPPEFESALYGAAGIAHDAALTALLVERGADPNDGEVVYHTPESDDNGALHVLVESGKLTADSLATMLLRKSDWHDHDGSKWLLEHGADPNRLTPWGFTALHQAIRRCNQLQTIELMLNHGADPGIVSHGTSAVAMAARYGRGDVLELFARRGVPMDLHGADRLLAACAGNDSNGVAAIAAREPDLVRHIVARGSTLLREFAVAGNTGGVGYLLDLGVDVALRDADGDGYWGIAKESTALHVAAWRAHHGTVKLLIERGAPVAALDGSGRTPLDLAVRACVDSYWMHRRSTESVSALLAAGAPAGSVRLPSGYSEVDELLRRHASGV